MPSRLECSRAGLSRRRSSRDRPQEPTRLAAALGVMPRMYDATRMKSVERSWLSERKGCEGRGQRATARQRAGRAILANAIPETGGATRQPRRCVVHHTRHRVISSPTSFLPPGPPSLPPELGLVHVRTQMSCAGTF